MGRSSTKENKSIYQIAREEMHYSRAEAAEAMADFAVMDYRIVKIEEEPDHVRPDEVVAMAKAYNKPELRNYYCTQQCPIGRVDVPEVHLSSSIHEILVNMVVSLESVNQKKVRLMEILADGLIGTDEKQDFDSIQGELERISMTVESLQLWCEKMRLLSNGNND